MENVTDALIMAGQVLIFIVALSVCMSSFSTLRESISDITGQRETVKMVQGSKGYLNFIDSKKSNSIRTVGAETVVSSMYRSIKENYEIYIKLINPNEVEGIEGLVFWEAKQETNLGNFRGNDLKINLEDKLIKITIGRKSDGVNQDVNNILSEGFYKKIQNKRFCEYLGEYKNAGEDVALENKATKRIITYIEI